jgi:hypothetical protein
VQWLDPAVPADAERTDKVGFADAASGRAGSTVGHVRAAAAYVCRGQTCSLFLA